MKYAIWPGEEFYDKMLKECRNEAELATTMLLWRTGMHSSTLVERDFEITINNVYWQRTKTGRSLRATITAPEYRVIRKCLDAGSLPNTQRALRWWVRRIGDRAGYAEQAVSPLTFRHSRAVWLLDSGMPVHRVSALIGCSYSTLEKHYAQLEAERLV